MKKTKSIASLKKKLDKVFNKWIRERDLSKPHIFTAFGQFVCISCGATKEVHQMHAGHFYASTFTRTRWDERNVNGQCAYCNTFLHGNLLNYRRGMIAKYGIDVVDELERIHREPVKLDRFELEEKIEHYKG